jgi:hypothetical protein
MNNLIQGFKSAWNFWKFYPALVIPPGYWTSGDARVLDNFLGSDTGVKLRALWVQRLQYQEKLAMNDSTPTKFTNGVAWGCRAMIEHTNALLQISPSTSESVDLTERQLEGEFRSVNR